MAWCGVLPQVRDAIKDGRHLGGSMALYVSWGEALGGRVSVGGVVVVEERGRAVPHRRWRREGVVDKDCGAST